MAEWNELDAYVRSHYDVVSENESSDILCVRMPRPEGRSQDVFLRWRSLLDGAEDWVLIESVFAETDAVDLRTVLEVVGYGVCGGVAITGPFLTVRHAVPLADMSVEEFERPLALIALSADYLEKELLGADAY